MRNWKGFMLPALLLQGCLPGEQAVHPAPQLSCGIIEVMQGGTVRPKEHCSFEEGAHLSMDDIDTRKPGVQTYTAVLEKDGSFTVRDVTVVVHSRDIPECIAGERYTDEGTCTVEYVITQDTENGQSETEGGEAGK